MDFIVKKFYYIIQIYKVYDVNQKFIESSIKFNMIILEKKIKIFQIFFKEFLKRKNKYVLIRKFNTTSNEKKNKHPTFKQYKITFINLFSLYYMKNIT